MSSSYLAPKSSKSTTKPAKPSTPETLAISGQPQGAAAPANQYTNRQATRYQPADNHIQEIEEYKK